MSTTLDELQREIQQKENELRALKGKLHQIFPTADLGNDSVKEKDLTENDAAMLARYRSDEDPNNYEKDYLSLFQFVDGNLDCHKYELSIILYPVFVHMYLELVYNRHKRQARKFFEKFGKCQEPYHGSDLVELSIATDPEHLVDNRLMQAYRNSKASLRIFRDSFNRLKRFLTELKLTSIIKIISDHLSIDVFDGAMRTKSEIEMGSGALLGDPSNDYNKTQMFYGLHKDVALTLDDDDEDSVVDDDKPKKRKTKKETSLAKKTKVDPNSPPQNRIPIPEIKESDRVERVKALREMSKKVNLGRDGLPSVCFYGFANLSNTSITSLDISDDSSLLATGRSDSAIKLWSLNVDGLTAMRSADDLDLLDKESDDVTERIMDAGSATKVRDLHGHSGPVYSCSLSKDKTFMVSCSEDGTIRVWYLPLWTNVVCYTDCKLPVWDAKMSPVGHYFASCGEEGHASIWSTDQHKQIRVLMGHMSVVKCLEFHPNSNYIATGSNDRTVRVWDMLTGNCVRVFKGHKDSISIMKFSGCGRYLASTGKDKQIIIWDLSNGESIYRLKGHNQAVRSLAFSRDDAILASGSLDGTIKLWDINKVGSSNLDSDHMFDSAGSSNGQLEVGSFKTKNCSVLNLHFTRRNLLLGSGAYYSPF